MISPISYNHNHEEIIKSSEAKPIIVKPNILIPIPENDNIISALSSYLLNKYFAGKEKHNVTESYSSTEKNIQIKTTPTTKEATSTEFTSIIEVQNFTISSTLMSNLDSSNYNQNSHNFKTDDYNKKLNSDNPENIEKKLPIDEDTKLNINPLNFLKTTTFSPSFTTEKSKFIDFNVTSSLLDLKNGNKFHDVRNDAYSVASKDSISPEILIIDQQNDSNINHNKRKKRSLELFFNSAIQVSTYLSIAT